LAIIINSKKRDVFWCVRAFSDPVHGLIHHSNIRQCKQRGLHIQGIPAKC
jgi:hypothetical protein